MKRVILSISVLLSCVFSLSQVPESFSYQAIVRDGGDVLPNQPVSYLFSIVKGTLPGSIVYTEKHSVTTNEFGLVNLAIGKGTDKTGDFTTIKWGADTYSLQVELDPAGGTNYLNMGTTQLVSVPYALHAKTSSDAFSGDYNKLINAPAATVNDSIYIVGLTRADEDFIDFGTFENFTNSSDWSIIERVKMPVGAGTMGGWHFFRGKGWVDKEGDIAIQITTSQIYAWCQKGGWKSITYNAVFEEDTWYTICLQYDAANQTLALFVDGSQAGQITGVLPQDDSGNTNKLFWGGQDVDPSYDEDDLYSETSIVIASQDWLQRKLSLDEIQNYKGGMEPEAALFFSADISSGSVTDNSGNGHDGVNGNSPVYTTEHFNFRTEFNEPIQINNDLKVAGDLFVGGTITGGINIDKVHVSQITGLLGQDYTMVFPQILDNTALLEIAGVLQSNVVIVNGPGHETERISEYLNESNGIVHYRERAGFTMEYPLIFETTNQTDMMAVKAWFDESSPIGHNVSIVIKDLAGTETGRWVLLNYIPDDYEAGNDGRTRFKISFDGLPDNYNSCKYQNDFGGELSYNPATDILVEISGISTAYDRFTPVAEVNFEERTVTLTMDYNEGYKIYDWMNDIISGVPDNRAMSIIETTDGLSLEIERYNYFECIPIKYEHIYGFGLNVKLKARIVIAYGWREKG